MTQKQNQKYGVHQGTNMATEPNQIIGARQGNNMATEPNQIIGVRQGNNMATAFHPELTTDPRFHIYFIYMVLKDVNID